MTPALRRLRNALWCVGPLVVAQLTAHLAAAEIFSRADLQQIYVQATDRARELSLDAVITIFDRDGRALLVLRADGSPNVTAAEKATAISKAGTAVFLSSNEHAFSSRTAGFIIQPHFPPTVRNRPPGPLVGVGFSNLAFSDVNYFREPDGTRIPGTRLNGSPGGVPLFKNGVLLGAVGVTGDGSELEDASIHLRSRRETRAGFVLWSSTTRRSLFRPAGVASRNQLPALPWAAATLPPAPWL